MNQESNQTRGRELVPCQKARANLAENVKRSSRFPDYVFAAPRVCFFFDADWIFEGEFVERIQAMLRAEDGVCASIVDLDADGNEAELFEIDMHTTGAAYASFLNGPKAGCGWIHGISRFGCASNTGVWSIYCEKGNEIAVIGLTPASLPKGGSPLVDSFRALPISNAIAQPLSYGFSQRALSPQWREQMLRNYGASPTDADVR